MLKLINKLGGSSSKSNAADSSNEESPRKSKKKAPVQKSSSEKPLRKAPRKVEANGSASWKGSKRKEEHQKGGHRESKEDDGEERHRRDSTSSSKEEHQEDKETPSSKVEDSHNSHTSHTSNITGESLHTDSTASVDDDPEEAMPSIFPVGGMRKNYEGTEKSGHLEGVPISIRLQAQGKEKPTPTPKPPVNQSSSKNLKPSTSNASSVKPNPAETPELELMPALDACSSDDPQEQLRGLKSLRILSRGHKLSRLDMVAAGTVETLLQIQETQNEEVLNLLLLVLLNLTFDDENVNEMGVLIPFVQKCLSHRKQEVVESAAAIIFSLSRLEDHRTALLKPEVVEPLVKTLASGTDQGKRDSCKALFHLSYLPESYPILLEKGAVEPALLLLSPPEAKIAEKATCLLANISRCVEGCRAIAESSEGLASLVEVLSDGSHMGKEFAAAALLLIAQSNPDYKDDLVLESPFIALNGLQNIGTPRAKLKAAALLRLLRDEEDVPSKGET